MTTVAIDLGSARCGVARGPSSGPPCVALADVVEPMLDANSRPLRAAVDALAAHVIGAERCVLEIAPLYMPAGVTPQAATAMANAHAACERIADAVAERCAAMAPPVPVVRVPRATWAHRLIPHRSGGIPQPEARAAVLRWLEGSGSVELPGDDRIDAAGAYLWGVLPGLPRAPKIRRGGKRAALVGPMMPKGMRAKLRREAVARERREEAVARRREGGCACPRVGGRHARGCPMAPPPKVRGLTADGIARARAALAGFTKGAARA